MLFRKKERERCAVCNKELDHKHRPKEEWGIDGFLCGDCHLDKMREYYAEGKIPKKKTEKCDFCGRTVDPEDLYKPHKGLNLKGKVCKQCLEGKQKEAQKKFEYCAICGKKLGRFRYNPKNKWNIDGQLCRKCWDAQNMR